MGGLTYKNDITDELYREWRNIRPSVSGGYMYPGTDSKQKSVPLPEEKLIPTPWEWGREEELKNAWEAYNRGFSYDLNADPFYQQMVDRYTKSAQLGMEDTMGKAAALTGGYGNSYAVTAGQQAYYNQMDGLNDIAMSLYNNAYNQWRDSKNDALTKYSLLSEQKSNDYNQYLIDNGLLDTDEDDDDGDNTKINIFQEYRKIEPLLQQTLLEAGGGIDGFNAVAKELQDFYEDEIAEQIAAYFAYYGSQQGSK